MEQGRRKFIRFEYTFWLLLNIHLPKRVSCSQIHGPRGRLFEVGEKGSTKTGLAGIPAHQALRS